MAGKSDHSTVHPQSLSRNLESQYQTEGVQNHMVRVIVQEFYPSLTLRI